MLSSSYVSIKETHLSISSSSSRNISCGSYDGESVNPDQILKTVQPKFSETAEQKSEMSVIEKMKSSSYTVKLLQYFWNAALFFFTLFFCFLLNQRNTVLQSHLSNF
jgi:hypothetical protein